MSQKIIKMWLGKDVYEGNRVIFCSNIRELAQRNRITTKDVSTAPGGDPNRYKYHYINVFGARGAADTKLPFFYALSSYDKETGLVMMAY
jgi:hypothetical protein